MSDKSEARDSSPSSPVAPVAPADPPAPPDGGLQAWLQVAAGFFLWFNSWGFVNTFGVYQTYYELDLLRTSSASDISWIGSFQVFLLMFGGFLVGPLYDMGYVRHIVAVGGFFVVFGQMMLSLCTSYWQVFLAQGLTQGLGATMLFHPGVAVLTSGWFSSRLALAAGIAAAGSVILPIVFNRLEPQIGFGWATRVLGFISLATMTFTALVVKAKSLPPAPRRFFDPESFKDLAYVLDLVGCFWIFLGLYVPSFFIVLYSVQSGFTTGSFSAYLLAILNAGSIPGRLLPTALAGKLGVFNVLTPCAAAAAIICFCLIAVMNAAGIIVISVFFGFFSGSLAALAPMSLVALTLPDRKRIGTRLGMGFAVAGVGLLIGNPISGAILGSSRFTWAWVFGGLAIAVGALVCFLIMIVQRRRKA
ncbi:hypothetical protein M409DRAFT_25106 [Zasmidium cellare ATCC 36951]|uniref:Major facilitator superfamily (MFS) profile domain-containing protein n=1 Tax=Zasmidium cellare ATCC 36951 TaxID=1080233 RepID=A0A6A6CFK6_ZASCE|nr:uncharacterized protein M409DRAFT_25106 [Zasmidium cellare ATCC 36951]KAF2164712.1 hypothetical protein M409DRAFT_25106 [Zasmidium cellare ATCC 36951]